MLLLALLPSLALANGQTSHIWICREALEALPDGELRDLLTREDLEPYLINGAMFPDGGYAVDHPYGEAAHWEPFQDAFRAWITANYEAPYSDEGAQVVAFLFGMACHGMADQVYDSLYMEYSKVYDAEHGWSEAGTSMDEATDVAWAAITGAQEPPDAWIPDVFPELYAGVGIDVDAGTMADGQQLLRAAVALVGLFGESETAVAKYQAQFPWATTHEDTGTPGAPPFEAWVCARYWQGLWARLQDEPVPYPITGTNPVDGGMGHPTDATMPEARVSVIFAHGLRSDDVSADQFEIVDDAGLAYSVEPNLFYRDDSHAVNLHPTGDGPADTDFTVTEKAGLVCRDGAVLGDDQVFGFSTRPPPADTGADTADTGSQPQINPTPREGCGCASSSQSGGWVPVLGVLLGLVGLRRQE